MYSDARKIHLLEAVLKTTDEKTLQKLEEIVNAQSDESKLQAKHPRVYDFLGILSKEEAATMQKAIKETAEQIHPDDWK